MNIEDIYQHIYNIFRHNIAQAKIQERKSCSPDFLLIAQTALPCVFGNLGVTSLLFDLQTRLYKQLIEEGYVVTADSATGCLTLSW